jgi:predicted membrane channel-forming protein YqfA (hemolysin III family)
MNSTQVPVVLQFVLLAWSILWKGIALWNASKNSQRNWFIVMLIVNTIGVLEIIYLFRFAKKRLVLKDLLFWKSKPKS